MVRDKDMQEESVLAQDLKAVFDTSFDVIYVADGNGVTLRVSAAAEGIWGLKPESLIGKTVYEHEEAGIFSPSVVGLVLKKKERIQTIQTTKTGRRLLVVGTPIKDHSGNIVRVINTSRDITEESHLRSELNNIKTLMEGYRIELEQLRDQNRQEDLLISKSKQMEKIKTLVQKVAQVDSTVLISGESGVGKEVIANMIHHISPRKKKPFIKINCGSIPESLLESELFGYEPGAFTGALNKRKLGMFELANEGTIFLDEIGEMPLQLQTKLLRVIQEKEFIRLGGAKPIKVDIRILAATNQDLAENINKGTFRKDLFYRLNVVPIVIPPLRERKDDVIPLAFMFLEKFNSKYSKTKKFSNDGLNKIHLYDWPGNVRELQNIIERLIITSEGDVIGMNDLPQELLNNSYSDPFQPSEVIPLQEALVKVERELLILAKEKYKTTQEMANVLKVNQSTISRKLKKLNIMQ